jgi:serine/threonine-protein kinase
MDFFEGVTLNSALMRGGRMPPAKAARMIAQVCLALDHAHAKGIIHRDLKPSNILLAYPEQCRVIDFGLGVYVETAIESRLTKTGEMLSGDHFMAKELLSNPRLTDHRSDIYSIGAVWYQAVTNEVPAGADLSKSLSRVDGLPPQHRDIILHCLADIRDRFTRCSEVVEAIADADKEDADKEKEQL